MLISIGRRRGAEDLTSLLLECHARIRHFSALAVRLASSVASPEDRAAAAASIARYFEEALPLHVRDEDESVIPRLRDCARATDALDRIGREHRDHEPLLAELVALAGEIAADAGTFAAHQERLRALSATLQDELGSHLELEERAFLPMIAAHLSVAEQRAILVEMRARRS